MHLTGFSIIPLAAACGLAWLRLLQGSGVLHAPFRVENGRDKKKFRSLPFSIFDPIVFVFTKKYRNEREFISSVFFLRNPIFIRIKPVFIPFFYKCGTSLICISI